jgi:hypothetical protein
VSKRARWDEKRRKAGRSHGWELPPPAWPLRLWPSPPELLVRTAKEIEDDWPLRCFRHRHSHSNTFWRRLLSSPEKKVLKHPNAGDQRDKYRRHHYR